MYVDISAATAQWETDSVKGAKLRVKQLNRAGGLLGRKDELVILLPGAWTKG